MADRVSITHLYIDYKLDSKIILHATEICGFYMRIRQHTYPLL